MRFSSYSRPDWIKTAASITSILFVVNHGTFLSDAVIIEVGGNPFPGVGWIEGVCYAPIIDVRVGDGLEFSLTGHNVYKMPSKNAYETCEFEAATLLAKAGSGKYKYTITEEDARRGDVYFACGVGSHCLGNQKVKVSVASGVNDIIERPSPTSTYVLRLSNKECLKLQYDGGISDTDDSFEMDTSCTEPVILDDGGYQVTCLSPPATLTPGGVMWEARIMYYPFPKDRRVRNGERVWEFVEGDPGEDGFSGLTPSPINRLYAHHLSGIIVFGQGAEASGQTNFDTKFSKPYGMVTGDEGDLMIFHLIDLRDVDEWLLCVECRCKDTEGVYLPVGGVNCCTNCTTTAAEPTTIDYRMRYNVTYYEIEEDKPIERVVWLTADQSPSVGANIEYNVPQFDSLPQDQQLVNSDNPDQKMQRLERFGPFNTIFQEGYFEDDYDGPDTVKILRCVAHLHTAAIAMYLEDTVTGKIICAGTAKYGTDPDINEGFLIGTEVNNYEEPIEIPSDRLVRLVTDYDAREPHTGVMAIIFMFVSSGEEITSETAALNVAMCLLDTCDVSLLPSIEDTKPLGPLEDCLDELAEHPMCKFGNLCTCENVVNAPESNGCNGMYASSFGDVEINSICSAYCGCPDDPLTNEETVDLTDTIIEMIESQLNGKCLFATDNCKFLLSNLYTCAELTDDKEIDPVMIVVRDYGQHIALEYAKLGEANLHVEKEDQEVTICGLGSDNENDISCEDTLKSHPACEFGSLCDCKDFVDAPESSGCGGVYTSDFGDIQVNDVCVAYCEACDDISENEDNMEYTDCGVCHEQASSPAMSSLVVVATLLLILTFMLL